jgi:hypothetical protein
MKIIKPKANDKFTITAVPGWPSFAFETDAAGQHTWNWTISWGSFKKSGSQTTPGNLWDAQSVVTNLGGSLTVMVSAAKQSASITVKIYGTNPSAADVTAYLTTKPGSDGFDKLVEHESNFRQFNASNEPVKSFDNGYGMCQLTSPAPSYEQVWNWKLNVDGGLALFASKRASAVAYLSQSGRTYTSDQLKYETVCRWNGGAYHEWDAKAGAWVRKTEILCDPATGNIGWNMTDPQNKGKTVAELHKRDAGTYSHRPSGAHWFYSGVCYADAVLG